jgi:single-strand DNA-binding protein
MSTQSTLTVTGFVGSSVRFSVGKEGGVPYASFRLGSTQRVYDRATQAFKDTPTQWYTVKVWRHVAANVVQSLRKGDPVLVIGRLRTEEWVSPEGPRTSVVIEASSLGHDLVFGTSRFDRAISPAAAGAQEPAGEGAPVDVSGLALADDEPDADEAAEPEGDDDLDELAEALARAGAEHEEALAG